MAKTESTRRKKYNPKTERKGGKLTLKKKKEVKEKIKETFETYGTINKLALARELGVNRDTIVRTINEIDLEVESLPAIKIELKLIFEKMKNRLIYLWKKIEDINEVAIVPDIKSELEIMKEIRSTIDSFYKLLQEFGEAPKAQENINIQHNVEVEHTIKIEERAKQILIDLEE